jgi:hypothetical protein
MVKLSGLTASAIPMMEALISPVRTPFMVITPAKICTKPQMIQSTALVLKKKFRFFMAI